MISFVILIVNEKELFMIIDQEIQALEEYALTHRRALHKIPELGFNEYKTSAYIKKVLDELNVPYKESAKTGVIGFINKDQEKTIAFRSDMDALNIEELNDISFKSTIKENMHACGHDGHMSMLLTFAKFLKKHENKLNVNVVLIFQPAEEGPGGAEVLINEGLIETYCISEIYGTHLYPNIDEGKIGLRKGPMMASVGEFKITIYGKSSHGAMPHLGIDTIAIAAQFISQVQRIISREIHPTTSGVVSIGKIDGGTRTNIIAEKVEMYGTIRAFDAKTNSFIQKRIVDILKGLKTSYSIEFDTDFNDMYPVVNNDSEMVDDFIKANGEDNVLEIPLQMISEDFSYYQKKIPGLFVFLGVRNESKGFINGLHSSSFNFDEKNLLYGVQSYINVMRYRNYLED
jgi:amidohydrolase